MPACDDASAPPSFFAGTMSRSSTDCISAAPTGGSAGSNVEGGAVGAIANATGPAKPVKALSASMESPSIVATATTLAAKGAGDVLQGWIQQSIGGEVPNVHAAILRADR